MFSLIKNKNIFILGLVLGLLFISVPVRVAEAGLMDGINAVGDKTISAIIDFVGGSSGSTGWTDFQIYEFKINGGEDNADLPTLPGLKHFRLGDHPTTLEEIESFSQENIQTAKELQEAMAILEEEKTIVEPKVTTLKTAVNWFNGLEPLTGDLFPEKKRLWIINNMIGHASLKLKEVQRELDSYDKQITDLGLIEAEQSGDPEKVREAKQKVDLALQKLRTSRKEVQIESANRAALTDASCWPGGSLTPNVGNCILIGTGWVANIIVGVFALLLWAASSIFDGSVYMSITMVSLWFKIQKVREAWVLIRDFANIFFVFVLLYIAIGTIFDLQGIGGRSQRLIANVIIIALLVNFSGFFVRVAVDASNMLAFEFYNSMREDNGQVAGIGTKMVKKMDLGAYFIDANTVSDARGATAVKAPRVNRLSFFGIITQTFGNILIILAASFVLIVASILFIIRTVVLLFLYIISPLAITSYIIPNPNFNYFKRWSQSLIKQAFFAPAFLIPFYVVFLILGDNGIANLTGANDGWGIVAGGSLTLVVADILILGLLISCIFIAQRAGAIGSELAPTLASGATALAARPLSRYGGRLANRAGAAIAGSEYARRIAGSYPGQLVRRSWDTGVLRGARDTAVAQRVGQAMRNPLNTVGAGIGAAAGAAGIKGVGNVFGTTPFSRQVEERASTYLTDLRSRERPEDRAVFLEGLMGTTKREEFNAVYGQLNAQERRELETAAATTNVDLARRLREQRVSLRGRAAQQTATEQVQNNRATGANIAAVEHLNQEDLNAVYRSLTPQQRAQLGRDAAANPALTARLTAARTALGGGGARETAREEARAQRLADAIADLALGPIASPLIGFANPVDMRRINILRSLEGETFRDFILDNSILDGTHTDLYPYFTAGQLRVILSENSITHPTRQGIRAAILGSRPHGTPHPTDTTIEESYQYLFDPVRGGTAF